MSPAPTPSSSASAFDVWHVAFPVRDVDASLAFYLRLGFTLVGRDEYPSKRQAFVAVAPGGFTIELYEPRGPAGTNAAPRRPDHLAFECRAIAALRERLVASGLAVPEVEEYDNGVKTFELRDPDGVGLEFFQGRALYEASIAPRA